MKVILHFQKYPLATLFLKQLTADKYTTALGSYCAWNRHVNLSPPDFVKEVPENDKHIYNYYDALQYTLYETNYAETEDRTTDPRTTLPGSGISIVILASPVECMAILLEGGRRCPGDMLLVMSKSWITVVPSDLDPSMNKLLVHKAISFESGGRSFIDVFDPPRRVTYFVNFFTRSITDGQTGDGEDLEVNLECPMSSSLKLVRRTDDKFWTRIIMAEANVAYPATLAFAYKVSLQYDIPNDAKLKVVKLSSKEGIENVMQEEILSFLNRLDENADRASFISVSMLMCQCVNQTIRMSHFMYILLNNLLIVFFLLLTQMVVKPSGVKWHGSVGVTFHPRNEPKRIIDAAIQLFMALDAGDGILVEVFCGPDENGRSELFFIILMKGISTSLKSRRILLIRFELVLLSTDYIWEKIDHQSDMNKNLTRKVLFLISDSELMRDYSFRLRANVCRGPNDVPITTTLICGVGKKNEPINGDNTKPQSYESTMIEWGLENDMERIKKLVVKGSANILKSIIRHENALTIEEKGGIGAQTDVIGR